MPSRRKVRVGREQVLPSTPVLTATAVPSFRIDLSWTASSDASGIASYTLQRSTNQATWTTLLYDTALAYADTGLQGGTLYYYRVSAVDTVGNRSAWALAQATTLGDVTKPTAPIVTVTGYTSSSISLSYGGSTDNVGVTSYVLQWFNPGNSQWVTLQTTAGASTYTHQPLASGTTYQYRCYALDAANNQSDAGLASAMTSAVSLAATYFIQPTNIGGSIKTFDGAISNGMAGANWVTTGGVTRLPQPGDIIEFAAGTHAQRMLSFKNLNGTQANPIVIRAPQNTTSRAIIRRQSTEDGFWTSEVNTCNWLTIDGYNSQASPYNCGFKWTYAIAAVNGNTGSKTGKDGPSAYIKFRGAQQGIVIKYIEVDGGWSHVDNMAIDPSAYGDGYSHTGGAVYPHDAAIARAPGVWTIQDCKFLYNYTHHCRNECFYLGSNYYDNSAPCRNNEVAYNQAHDCGSGFMHMKTHWEGVNLCHHNFIQRMGKASPTPTRSSITCGGVMKVYNNWIEDSCGGSTRTQTFAQGGRPDGIQGYQLGSGAPEVDKLVGVGGNYPIGDSRGIYGPYEYFEVEVFNNVIFGGGNPTLYAYGSSTHSHGIYFGVATPATQVLWRPKVYNNTVYGHYGWGVNIEQAYSGSFVKNNVVIDCESGIFSLGSGITQTNNTSGTDPAVFVSAGVDNYHLASPSSHPASGTLGVDIAATDYEDQARPQGAGSDRGAYED